MTAKQIAESIPHEYREKILLLWLNDCIASMDNENFRNLWDAYFVYVDPDAIKNDDCQACRNSILRNWRNLQPYLIEAERDYNLINSI